MKDEERLTFRFKNGNARNKCVLKPGREKDAVYQLAAYEDTGYSPDEIYTMEDTVKQLRTKIRESALEIDRLRAKIMEVYGDAIII